MHQSEEGFEEFCRTHIEEDPLGYTVKDELYRTYLEFCMVMRAVSYERVQFFKKLYEKYPFVVPAQKVLDGRKRAVVKGIRLKDKRLDK